MKIHYDIHEHIYTEDLTVVEDNTVKKSKLPPIISVCTAEQQAVSFALCSANSTDHIHFLICTGFFSFAKYYKYEKKNAIGRKKIHHLTNIL